MMKNSTQTLNHLDPNQTTKKLMPTPETCKHPERLQGVEKRIYDELPQLQELDQINPQTNQSYRAKFLQRFKWKDSVLNEAQKQQVEELLVEFSDIFANIDWMLATTPKLR